MTLLFCLIVAFSFFAQSLLGFGGGLISIPLLSLFMPVQDVVSVMIIFQLSMGWLLFKTWHQTSWAHIRAMVPAMLVGVVLGIAMLKTIPGDVMRLILAGYIILHLLRTHTAFDPLKLAIEKGGVHLSGFLGGMINAMIGGGGPAFILYLKDKAAGSAEFRANVMAILFLSNIPRVIGSLGTGMLDKNLLILGALAYPGFMVALFLGQKLHDRIPQKIFFRAVELILVVSAVMLIVKVML